MQNAVGLSQADTARKARARRKARRQGSRISKVRNWNRWLGNDGYIVIDEYSNVIEVGGQSPLSLDELENYLAEEEK